jgi:hypothetical protein
MTGKPRVANPEVIAFAEKTQLDLSRVRGTGPNDAITHDDAVKAHWERMRPALAEKAGLSSGASWAEIAGAVQARLRPRAVKAGLDPDTATLPQILDREKAMAEERDARTAPTAPTSIAAATRVAAKGPAFALNPRADAARMQLASAGVRPSGAAPTLFASGDLPAFTASGVPVESLLDVPWQARHAMAAAATPADAYTIVTECQGADAEQTAQMLYGSHQGNAAYAERVEQWRLASVSDEQLSYDGSTAAQRERERRTEALSGQPLPAEDEAMLDALNSGRYSTSNGRVVPDGALDN